MAYTVFKNGFTITSAAAIDRRIYLSKAEMVVAEEVYNLPDVYFAICEDDGRLYLYNANNVPSASTGKYKAIEELLDFDNSVLKANLNTAIENSQKIIQLTQSVALLNNKMSLIEPIVQQLQSDMAGIIPKVSALESEVDELQAWVAVVKVDGGEITPEEL